MPKGKNKKRVEKKSEWMGVVGFVLVIISIIILILVYGDYLPSSLAGSLILFYPLFILASLVLSIIQNSRKPTRLSRISFILSLLGLISIILFILILNIFVIDWFPPGELSCSVLQIRLVGASSSDNSVTINRMAGGADTPVMDVKIVVNGYVTNIISPEDKSLMELESKTYVVEHDIQAGDRIGIAPVVKTNKKEATCNVIGELRAV